MLVFRQSLTQQPKIGFDLRQFSSFHLLRPTPVSCRTYLVPRLSCATLVLAPRLSCATLVHAPRLFCAALVLAPCLLLHKNHFFLSLVTRIAYWEKSSKHHFQLPGRLLGERTVEA